MSADASGTAAARRSPLALATIGLTSIAAAGWLWGAADDSERARDASRSLAAGDVRGALRLAEDVRGEPARARAELTRALALALLGRLREADRAFAAANERDPDNWIVHREWAIALAALGEVRRARQEIARMRSLNPRAGLPVVIRRAR